MPGHSPQRVDSTEIWAPVPTFTSSVSRARRTDPRKLAWLSPRDTLTGTPRYSPSSSSSWVTSGKKPGSIPQTRAASP